jgi:hypothetical protein
MWLQYYTLTNTCDTDQKKKKSTKKLQN